MALTHLLYPLFLSSLLVLASAHNNYVSNQTPNVDTNQPNENLVGSHVNYLNFDRVLNHDQLHNHDLIPTNSELPKYVLDPKPQGTENIVDQVVQGGLIPNLINTIGIQGVVLCKKGVNTYIPIEGAVTRVTCPNYSYENGQKYYKDLPSSILSYETDEHGFFLVKLKELNGLNVKDCKVYLEYSPGSCNVPTDVNNGITGANISLLHTLLDKIYYTVGPFIYTEKTDNDYSAPSPGY